MGTVRKRGDKWSYRIDLGVIDGKRTQKEKGGFATKKEATAAMTAAENDLLKTGEYIDANQKVTMQQLYEEFITEEAPLTRKYSTVLRYKSLYRNQIEPEFAEYYLYQISTDKIQKFLNYKAQNEKNRMPKHGEEGLSASYVRSVYNFLLVLFAYAKKKKKNIFATIRWKMLFRQKTIVHMAKKFDIIRKRKLNGWINDSNRLDFIQPISSDYILV